MISLISVVIALFTLYRVELRGPSVKFQWLQAPAKWHLKSGWIVEKYVTNEEGDSHPVLDKQRLQLWGKFEAIIENFGSRTGVLYEIVISVAPLPKEFTFSVVDYETKPIAVAGKSTIPLVPSITFQAVVESPAHAKRICEELEGTTVTCEYRASRPLGRRVRDREAISVSRRLLMEATRAWAEDWNQISPQAVEGR